MGTHSGPLRGRFLGFIFFVVVIFEISETLDMSSKQLGEMFEGDSANSCGGKFLLNLMGAKLRSRLRVPGSEDPHQREQKFHKVFQAILQL